MAGLTPLGEVFKAAKAALWFGEVVQMGLGIVQVFLKQGRNAQAGQNQFQQVGLSGFHAVCLSLTRGVRKTGRLAAARGKSIWGTLRLRQRAYVSDEVRNLYESQTHLYTKKSALPWALAPWAGRSGGS